MSLDPSTLWAVVLLIAFLLSGVLLLAWRLTPAEGALGYWTLAIFLLAIGLSIGFARPLMSEITSVIVGNAAVLAAYGLMWAGTRKFDGRRPRLYYALLPAALWPLICITPPFDNSVPLRFILVALFSAVMVALTIGQLSRGGKGALRARRAVLAVMWVLLLINMLRLPFASLAASEGRLVLFSSPSFAWFGLVALGCTVVATFALVMMVRERSEVLYRSASVVDELTTLLNRRGFLAEAVPALPTRGPLAILMMDLDHFKQINDRFGHAEGDRVLAVFATVLKANLRQLDVAGRLGGEEFVALLPGLDLAEAGRMAERIRRAFQDAAQGLLTGDHAEQVTPVSVSIGVSATDRPSCDKGEPAEPLLRALLAQADRELYRAKSNGRNRVELAVFDPTRSESAA